MTKIKIPPSAISGFEAISKMNYEQITALVEFLKTMPVGTRLDDLDNYISFKIKYPNSRAIVQTLRSFSDLLRPVTGDFNALAEGLVISYVEQAQESVSEEVKNNLEQYLKLIFNNSENLKLTLKAYDLITDSDFLYSDSKIVTDIRLVFNDDIQANPRNALIVHHLSIDYFFERHKKILLALDLSDLKKLKSNIERAISKEETIRKDYETSFNVLNLSTDV